MKLINFPGLTCYTNGIVSIVNGMGLDYAAAFSSLWSETDFYYQPDREVYLSRRFPDALEALGLRFIMQLCQSPRQVEQRLSQLERGELFILGMDAFNVPWSQFYGAFHGPHFFVARYSEGNALACYDPTFDKVDVMLARAHIIAHAYDISRILPTKARPCAVHKLHDAADVLHAHPHTLCKVTAWISDCADSADCEAQTVRLAKYMDAMRNNRYLYRHFLKGLPPPYNEKHMLLSEELLSKWSALKTGLYKAAITQKAQLFDESRALSEGIIEEELSIAGRVLR